MSTEHILFVAAGAILTGIVVAVLAEAMGMSERLGRYLCAVVVTVAVWLML